ncbi:unnamed protein product [Durusdinium trenchii]
MCHPSPEQETLEQVLDARLEAVALQLSQLFTPSFPSDIPDPDPKILEFLIQSGLLDLQTQGLKFILKKLQFSTPSWSFMSKCLKNSRASSQLSKTLVIAEIAIAGLAPFMVTRSDKSEEDGASAKKRFVEVFPAASPDGKVMQSALESVCAKLLSDHGEESQAQDGCLQIMLSQKVHPTPSANIIALLLQFRSKFPKVKILFTEILLNPDILTKFLYH